MEGRELLRLVVDPTRQAILAALAPAEMPVATLVAAVGGEQSNVSHHLALLRSAGLVTVRRQGRQQFYRLADAELARVLAELDAVGHRLDQVLYCLRVGIPVGTGFHGYG